MISGGETANLLRLSKKCSQMDSIQNPYDIVRLREEVSSGLSWTTKDENVMNSLCYGIWQSVFPFCRPEDAAFAPSVEHGFFPDDVVLNDLIKTSRMTAVSFGGYRKDCIREKLDIPVFTVGPYIQYADSFYDDKTIKDLKARNGKTLLFFLGHSVNTASVARDYYTLIEGIKRHAEGYDTVLISLFWWDADRELVDLFEKNGFKVVFAGFVCDPIFLKRMRSIIELADCAVADAMGTHAVYCAAMGCSFSLLDLGSKPEFELRYSRPQAERINRVYGLLEKAASGECSDEERTSILGYYGGIGTKRSLDERKGMVQINRDLMRRTKGFRSKIPYAVEELLRTYDSDAREDLSALLRSAL